MEQRIEQLLSQMTREEKIALLSGNSFLDTRTCERLGVPALLMADGPHGIRDGNATCFPVGTAMGATWDTDLIEKVGAALGRETVAKGRQVLLGPCINIHRTPLGGRNFESFGEDPHLTSRIAVSYVKGLQSEKVGCSVKHYACNNQEWERLTISSEIDERALREIYLPAFKAAVREADAWTIMAAYNRVNGTYCCEHAHLLLDILKEEWGFRGFVVSDWGAVHSTVESANGGLDLEMPGPGKYFVDPLAEAVEKGEVADDVIDDKVRRILRVMFLTELIGSSEDTRNGELDSEKHRTLAREVAAKAMVLLKNEKNLLPFNTAALESLAVIGPSATIARCGGGGSSTVFPFYTVTPLQGLEARCGDAVKIRHAQGAVLPGDLPAIEPSALRPPDAGEGVQGLRGEYFDNIDLAGEPVAVRVDEKIDFEWGGTPPADGLTVGNYSVRWTGKLVAPKTSHYEIGLNCDEGIRLCLDGETLVDHWDDPHAERKTVTVSLEGGREYDLLIDYRENKGWSVVHFGMLETGDLLHEAMDAAASSDAAVVVVGLSRHLEGEGVDRKSLGLPGRQVELIKTVAQANPNTVVVLVNGAPVTMEAWVDDVRAVIEAWYPGQEGGNAIADVLFGDVNPSARLPVSFPKRLEDSPSHGNYPGGKGKVHYAEGIFVGYRHFDRNNVEPLFPFGHGLSYTSFAYSNLRVTPGQAKPGANVEVCFDVENVGDRAGAEVAQVYVRDVEVSVERPIKELKGFRKVQLEPGEKKTVTLALDESALSFYAPGKGWTAEPGDFQILVGCSSRDIRLEGTFALTFA